jgi:YD repeat-containing protein
VHTYAREQHTARLAPGEAVRVTHAIGYSDGFGREIQRKVPAEPGPDGGARWVGTGWTVYDEKSRPVRRYEPFFSSSPEFEDAATAGVSSILRYDPIGRLVATVRPDHTYEKVVFSPWHRARWDGNDTVERADPATDPDVGALIATLDPADYRPTWLTSMRQSADSADRAAAEAAVAHANTPSTVRFDATGHEFLTIVHNRLPRAGAVVEERYRTRTVHDVEGNLRSVVDAADRVVSQSRYDLLGRLIRQDSADQGRRTMLPDARDAVVSRWDGFGRRHAIAYDQAGRPVALRVDGRLVEETTYGEGVPGAQDANLRGRVARVRDQSGEVTTEAYDRRGAMLRSTRRLTASPVDRPDWSGPVGLGDVYTFASAYDALGRTVAETSPDGSVIRTEYNEAGLLERLTGTIDGADSGFVDGAAYDAHGRLTEFRYANGLVLSREYEPRTGRLHAATTTRGADLLQDLRYTYDPVGNIIRIRDRAQPTLFFANQVVAAGTGYVYDATYQLIEATGRALLGLRPGGEVRPAPHPADGAATARYVEQYAYDRIGNLTEIRHTDTDPAGTTAVTTLPYGPDGRLTGGYAYDAHGNLTAMPQLPALGWDEHDRLAASTGQQAGPGATPQTTHYRYDAGGHRVRKATERYAPAGAQPTLAAERIYLGALEIYREYDGTGRTVTLERLTVHVGAGGQRIAMAERRTAGADPAPARQTRFPIGDHLGSTCLEVDGGPGTRVISYTEYLPYGGTATAAVAGQTETSPRYGYTGRERDEETGLSYQGARYDAAWTPTSTGTACRTRCGTRTPAAPTRSTRSAATTSASGTPFWR